MKKIVFLSANTPDNWCFLATNKNLPFNLGKGVRCLMDARYYCLLPPERREFNLLCTIFLGSKTTIPKSGWCNLHVIVIVAVTDLNTLFISISRLRNLTEAAYRPKIKVWLTFWIDQESLMVGLILGSNYRDRKDGISASRKETRNFLGRSLIQITPSKTHCKFQIRTWWK